MTDREDDEALSRRGLFKRLAAGLGMAGAGVGATVSPRPASSATPEAKAGGYRKTEHVRKVYAAART